MHILNDGLRMIRANNPSPMTHSGTNTYLIGTTDLAVIDPGPLDEAHLAAILDSLTPGQSIGAILVTHSHMDHSPLAGPLAQATGAPVLAFGPSHAGRTATMAALAASDLIAGGEGVDADFVPTTALADGQQIVGSDWTLRAHWTPGHMANHLCFEWLEAKAVFTGDLVMGWASSLISPPDGDVGQFLRSLDRLDTLDARILHAGHGDPIADPSARIDWLRRHRLGRREAVWSALDTRPLALDDLVGQVYADVDPAMWPAAKRNLLAHLIELVESDLATASPTLSQAATFARKET